MFGRRFALMIVVPALLVSCKYFRPASSKPAASSPPPAAPPKTAPSTTAAPVPTAKQAAPDRDISRDDFSDANIAAMVLALNNTDISYARLVPTHAERDDVKQFAQRMLTDHASVNGLVTDLLAKLDVTPVDNASSLDLRDESAEKRDMMRELSGYAFDSTYIENEVGYHTKFLKNLDNVMLPRARNSQLKTLLTTVRPAVAAHLSHAEQVRSNVLAKR